MAQGRCENVDAAAEAPRRQNAAEAFGVFESPPMRSDGDARHVARTVGLHAHCTYTANGMRACGHGTHTLHTKRNAHVLALAPGHRRAALFARRLLAAGRVMVAVADFRSSRSVDFANIRKAIFLHERGLPWHKVAMIRKLGGPVFGGGDARHAPRIAVIRKFGGPVFGGGDARHAPRTAVIRKFG